MKTLLTDLHAESADLDALVAELDPEGWAMPTPAPGWTVAHQIAHLAWTDTWTGLSATAPDRCVELIRAARKASGDTALIDLGADEGARQAPAELLARWRTGREQVLDALGTAPADSRLPWFGPPMKPASMATARIMETWAHGQDVADALGVRRAATVRLRHIAHLGVLTRAFSFDLHGLPVPQDPVRVELRAPDGTLWTHGPDDAADRVVGPMLDFCLLVTQRRHSDDLELTATGDTADGWLTVAQAFAGPPGPGRARVSRRGCR